MYSVLQICSIHSHHTTYHTKRPHRALHVNIFNTFSNTFDINPSKFLHKYLRIHLRIISGSKGYMILIKKVCMTQFWFIPLPQVLRKSSILDWQTSRLQLKDGCRTGILCAKRYAENEHASMHLLRIQLPWLNW